MRFIVTFIVIILLYYAIKTLIRSALQSYRNESQDGTKRGSRLPGEEMVLDPNCRTYVPKGRAIVKSRRGGEQYFCSEACASEYERLHKD